MADYSLLSFDIPSTRTSERRYMISVKTFQNSTYWSQLKEESVIKSLQFKDEAMLFPTEVLSALIN